MARLLVAPDVPSNLCCCPRNDTICGTDSVGVAVVTDSTDSEMGGCSQDVRKIPSECDNVAWGNLVIRGGSLGRLSYCDETSRGRSRDIWARGRALSIGI